MEDTTDSISINDFQGVQLEVGSLDLNTVGSEEGQEEEEEEVGEGGGRRCIDKVCTIVLCSAALADMLMIYMSGVVEYCHYQDTLRLYINWIH